MNHHCPGSILAEFDYRLFFWAFSGQKTPIKKNPQSLSATKKNCTKTCQNKFWTTYVKQSLKSEWGEKSLLLRNWFSCLDMFAKKNFRISKIFSRQNIHPTWLLWCTKVEVHRPSHHRAAAFWNIFQIWWKMMKKMLFGPTRSFSPEIENGFRGSSHHHESFQNSTQTQFIIFWFHPPYLSF